MRTFFNDIVRDRRRTVLNWPVRFILRVLSIPYAGIVNLKNLLYDRAMLKPRQAPCRVVCIGNLTAGGTGKTPLVIMTARMLADHDVKVAVVTRGYRRRSGGTLVVSDGSTMIAPDRAGDEPHLIASSLPGIPVVVGGDRYRVAMLACERFKPNTIILDDGFQHRRLYRDVDILAMDANDPVGSEFLLPRGLLREPHRNMKRAKAVVFTRTTDRVARDRAERTIRYYDKTIPIVWSRVEATGLRRPGEHERQPASSLAGKNVAALSNVAEPESFYGLLEQLGAAIVLREAKPDHHRHTAVEIAEMVRRATSAGAGYLVMTAKDERNLPPAAAFDPIEARVLDIQAVLIDNEQAYRTMVLPHGVT
jgi:tetraacyldisaccharide 4'-kinase